MIYRPIDENAKRRLTDPQELQDAVRQLLEQGFHDGEIAAQLAHCYYVDIDALNDVLGAMDSEAGADQPGNQDMGTWPESASTRPSHALTAGSAAMSKPASPASRV